jgi:hypothetical protein
MTSRNKSFIDLKFENNKATIKLKNGYIVVVRTGKGTATTIGSPYEFELIPLNSKICDDKIGYCTEEEITQLMYESQSLSKIK